MSKKYRDLNAAMANYGQRGIIGAQGTETNATEIMNYLTDPNSRENDYMFIKIDLLDDYRDPDGNPQPFRLYDEDKMTELIESISNNGLMEPIIVRPNPENKERYQILAGHNRKFACETLGYRTIKALVKELDDNDAALYVCDTNIKRDEILPSEKAKAYKLRYDAMKKKHGGDRKSEEIKFASGELDSSKRTLDVMSEIVGEGKDNINRFIRLNYLIPELLDATDAKELKIRPAVELSYLSPEEQYNVLRELGTNISYDKAKNLKEIYKVKGHIPSADLTLAKDLPDVDKLQKRLKLTIRLKTMLPRDVRKVEEQEEYVAKCIKYYQEHHTEEPV